MNKSVNKNDFLDYYYKQLILLIAVLFLAVAYFFFWRSKIDVWTQYKPAVMVEKQNTLNDEKKVLNEWQELSLLYKKISPELRNRVQEFLPNSPELAKMYYTLDQLASKANFKLLSVTANEVQVKQNQVANVETGGGAVDNTLVESGIGSGGLTVPKPAKQMDVNAVLEGAGYQNIKTFVDLLVTNLRLLDIKSLNYNPGDTSFEIVFKTYYTE